MEKTVKVTIKTPVIYNIFLDGTLNYIQRIKISEEVFLSVTKLDTKGRHALVERFFYNPAASYIYVDYHGEVKTFGKNVNIMGSICD